MINEYNARKFCCEDISLIENYAEAIADTTQTWVCHHRLECVDGIFTSPAILIEKELYKNRPASELIFLTPSEHRALHNKDPKMIKKISEARKGKPLSEEHKKHLSEAHLGKKLRPFSEEHKQKIRDSLTGKPLSEEHKQQISDANKGKHWWNNGVICIKSKTQPTPEFIRGRIKKKTSSLTRRFLVLSTSDI